MIRLIKGNIYLWRNRVYVEYIGIDKVGIQLFKSINRGIIRIPDSRISDEITSDSKQ